MLPIWLYQGRAMLKHQIARRVTIKVENLPYHPDFLDFLYHAHQQKRPLYLVTASNISIARQVAAHLGIFTDIIASDEKINLKGQTKGLMLKQRFGERQFSYAGNDASDLAVWQYASTAIVVNGNTKLQQKAALLTELEQIYQQNNSVIKSLPKILRVHQWVKNVLIFIPLLASHLFTDIGLVIDVFLAFLAFCLVASAGYIINDIIDLDVDRQHHNKKQRAFASGQASIQFGLLLIPVLLMMAFALSSLLPLSFSMVLIFYFALTLSYSLWLKSIVLVDAFCLAFLYTLRVIAGVAAASSFILTYWLLAFSMFLFLCLAFVKRYSELLQMQKLNKKQAKGRGYLTTDLSILANIGVSSGYISVLVLALYISNERVRTLYETPDLLWLVCLLMLYWVSYVWLMTHRDLMHDDPIVFALKDRVSHITALFMGLIVGISSLGLF
jgi:4-hydroxybenzoate polyprenyltransferase